jgi:hypothetical protein
MCFEQFRCYKCLTRMLPKVGIQSDCGRQETAGLVPTPHGQPQGLPLQNRTNTDTLIQNGVTVGIAPTERILVEFVECQRNLATCIGRQDYESGRY